MRSSRNAGKPRHRGGSFWTYTGSVYPKCADGNGWSVINQNLRCRELRTASHRPDRFKTNSGVESPPFRFVTAFVTLGRQSSIGPESRRKRWLGIEPTFRFRGLVPRRDRARFFAANTISLEERAPKWAPK